MSTDGIGAPKENDAHLSAISELLQLQPSAEHLSKLVDATQGIPCGPSQNALQVLLGLQTIDSGRGDPLETLYHLSECHSISLRQYMVCKSACRLHQHQVKSGRHTLDGSWPAGTQESLLDMRRRLLQFPPTPDRRQDMLNVIRSVPPDWTVIQLTAVPRARTRTSWRNTPELVVARFHGGAPESLVLARVSPPMADEACTFRAEFEAIMADNSFIQKKLQHDRSKYWAHRGELDQRMKAMVKNMEAAWLGRLSYLVSGAVTCHKQQQLIEEALSSLPSGLTAAQRAQLRVLCSRPPNSDAEFSAAISDVLQRAPLPPAKLKRLLQSLTAQRRSLRKAALLSPRSGQVILVLDKDVQQYPWEMVGPLAKSPVCRLPSLAILELSLISRPVSNTSDSTLQNKAASETTKTGVEKDNSSNRAGIYILNPSGDLKSTEERMGPFLEGKGWDGIVGRPPTVEEFAAALTDGEIFAYCGHGSGSQYLPTDKLRQLSCNAVALLFGCGSGRLLQPGPTSEPHGNVHSYLIANCPAVLGNLWSVTDNVLDTYSKAVIDKLTGSDGGDRSPSIPEAAATARAAVSSAFMAAAPVVYGLPVTADGQARTF